MNTTGGIGERSVILYGCDGRLNASVNRRANLVFTIDFDGGNLSVGGYWW